MGRNLDFLLTDEAARNLTDLPDTTAAMDAEYERGERTYRKSLTDVSKNLASEAIRRNVYTQGGELDKGVQRAFDEVYATPLGDFTRGLAIDAAKQRFANRQTAIQTGQGVSTAQEGARQARRTLAETGRQFDVQQSGVMTDAPQVDPGGNWIRAPRPTTDWLPPEPAADTQASMVGGPGGTKAPPVYPGGQPAPVTGSPSLARPTVAGQPAPRLTLAGARQAADIAQQKIGNVITSAAAQGKAAVLNPDGTLQTNADGSVKLVDSLDAKRLQLQTTETMGGYVDPDTKKWVPTLQGKATTQDIASKQAADQRAWIEMYGGGAGSAPPITFTAEEFQSAPIDAKQGDANYDAKWDLDGDGVITVGDVTSIGGEAKDVGNGTFQYTPTAAAGGSPRTLEGQKLDVQARELAGRLGLDLQKFKEGQDQFTRTMKLDRQKFMTDASGYVYDENLQPVGMKNPDGTTRPMTTLDRDKFTEMQNEFNANFDEAQYRFDITAGLDQRQIDATDRQTIQALNMQLWLGVGKIAADLDWVEIAKGAAKVGKGIYDFVTNLGGGGGTGNNSGNKTGGFGGGGVAMKPVVGGQAKVSDDEMDTFFAGQYQDGGARKDLPEYLSKQSDEVISEAIKWYDRYGLPSDPTWGPVKAEAAKRGLSAGSREPGASTSGAPAAFSSGNPLELRPDYRARPQSRSSLVTAPGQPYNFATQQPNLPGFDPKLSPPPGQTPVTPVRTPGTPLPGGPPPPVGGTQPTLPAGTQPTQPYTGTVPQRPTYTKNGRIYDAMGNDLGPAPTTGQQPTQPYTGAVPQRSTFVKNGRVYNATGEDLGPAPPTGQLPGGPQPGGPGEGGVAEGGIYNPEPGGVAYKPATGTFTKEDMEQFPIDAKKGDPRYRPDWDFDGNGENNMEDFFNLANQATGQTPANGQFTFTLANVPGGVKAGGFTPGAGTADKFGGVAVAADPSVRTGMITPSQPATMSQATGAIVLGDGTRASVRGDDSVIGANGAVIGQIVRNPDTQRVQSIRLTSGEVVQVNQTWDALAGQPTGQPATQATPASRESLAAPAPATRAPVTQQWDQSWKVDASGQVSDARGPMGVLSADRTMIQTPSGTIFLQQPAPEPTAAPAVRESLATPAPAAPATRTLPNGWKVGDDGTVYDDRGQIGHMNADGTVTTPMGTFRP